MTDLLRRYGAGLSITFVTLSLFWLVVLVILPNIYLLEQSFRYSLPIKDVGGPRDVYTIDNYARFFRPEEDGSMGIHLRVFLNTLLYSSVVTVICFAICYPIAYYLAKVARPKLVPTLFLLLTIPLLVSEALRAFAWFVILALKGPLNAGLLELGLLEKPIRWMVGFQSVLIGLVYVYVLFMLLPIYSAIQSLDSNQIEAAQDLGSPWWRTHWRVVLPHAKPGIASGSVMVFMLSAGSLLVPVQLASTTSRWFTQTIQAWFFEQQDWNSGAAYAFVLLVLCTVFVTLVMKLFRVGLSDIAK